MTTACGYVYIESGSLDITAANDGIQAQTVLKIQDGDFDITTGGGSSNASSDPSGGWGIWGSPQSGESEESSKALKAASLILISGGEFKIDSSDDSVHSNGDIQIDGGDFSLSSGDDGINAAGGKENCKAREKSECTFFNRCLSKKQALIEKLHT